MEEIYRKIADLVDGSKKVLIISHRSPDGDTLGAAIALKIWLARGNKSATLACVDLPAATFAFLPCIDQYVSDFEISDFDLVFVVDAGASYMTNFHLKYDDFFTSGVEMVNIDHHVSNDYFGTVNLVDIEAASTTVVIFEMLKFLGVDLDGDISTALMTGIYNDTGSFMHSNTTADVLMIAGELLSCGARLDEITKAMFQTKRVNTLRLLGRVLENAQLTDDNVVLSVLSESDFNENNACEEDLSGAVNYLNMVPGAKFALLVNEDCKGNVKGSLRTQREEVDVSKIAAEFGGGGHSKASGFMMEGRIHRNLKYHIVSQDMSKTSLEF